MRCDCSVTDFDAPKVYDQTFPVARKGHVCCECDSPIKKGERYELTKALYDIWDTYRTCLTCTRIRSDYCPKGYVHMGLAETLEYCLGLDYRVKEP